METAAIFRAIVRSDGVMVAALAAIPEGKARFFVAKKRETTEEFVGRVSSWIKEQGATGLQMYPPDVLAEGVEVAQVLMRIAISLGAERLDLTEGAELDIENAEIVFGDDLPSN